MKGQWETDQNPDCDQHPVNEEKHGIANDTALA